MNWTKHFHAVIMAGGKGERFWPWSRTKRPKQLLPLLGKKTMIEVTVDRLLPLIPKERIWIVTNVEYAKKIRKLMPQFPRSNFILEPVGKNSAGAVLLGCATVARKDPQAVMAMLPADHCIKSKKKYLKVLKRCFEVAARSEVLVTLGVKPAMPNSGYGYIERGKRVVNLGFRDPDFYSVKRFIEKPARERAKRLIQTGKVYWNAGMFVWSARSIENAFKKFSRVHARGWEKLQKNSKSYLAREFHTLPHISIDYAIMEKARNLWVAEGKFDWDDVGAWDALFAHRDLDRQGNVGEKRVLFMNSKECLVLGSQRWVGLLGVNDLIVVETEDALLVCHRDFAQQVKKLVERLPNELR